METISIIQLGENKIQGIEILVANVSIAEKNEFDFLSNLSESFVLVVSKDSHLSSLMINDPTKEISIDLSDFSLRRIKLDNIYHEFGYLHNDLIEEVNSLKNEGQKVILELEDSLNDCILSCHVEMFFYFLFNIVFIREFENKSQERKNWFERYKDVVAVLVMDVFKIKHDNFDDIDEKKIMKIRELYADSLDYLPDFAYSIRYFVGDNSSAKEISIQTFGDQKYNYDTYIQRTIIKAMEIIEKRIVMNLNSTDFFSHEITITPSNIQLKIFPTPLGFENFYKVLEIWNEGKVLIDYLNRNNFILIDDKNTISEMKTKWILKHNEIISVFYNDRKNSLSYCSFGMQNRSKIFECIFNQGQINLTLLKK